MNFLYLETAVRNASIDIESVGNTCIQAFTDDGAEYYLDITTELGKTTVKQFGPFLADYDIDIGQGFSYTRYTLEYNEAKLYKIIDKFINPKGAAITQVFECSRDAAYKRLNIINW